MYGSIYDDKACGSTFGGKHVRTESRSYVSLSGRSSFSGRPFLVCLFVRCVHVMCVGVRIQMQWSRSSPICFGLPFICCYMYGISTAYRPSDEGGIPPPVTQPLSVTHCNMHWTPDVVCRLHVTAHKISANTIRYRSRAFNQVRVEILDSKHLAPHTSDFT